MNQVRSARCADATRIAQLADDLGYSIDPVTVGATIDRLRPSEGAAFVSEAGEDLTGWVHVYRSDLLQTEPFAEVGGLVIDPANRGVGNGQRLLEAAEQWAESNNLTVIRVRSNVVRPKARSFYKRRGYEIEKMSYTFTKRLDDL